MHAPEGHHWGEVGPRHTHTGRICLLTRNEFVYKFRCGDWMLLYVFITLYTDSNKQISSYGNCIGHVSTDPFAICQWCPCTSVGPGVTRAPRIVDDMRGHGCSQRLPSPTPRPPRAHASSTRVHVLSAQLRLARLLRTSFRRWPRSSQATPDNILRCSYL